MNKLKRGFDMKKLFLLLFAAAFLFSACSDDDPVTVTLPSGGTLTKNWVQACEADFGGGSSNSTLTFGASTFSNPLESWITDTACGGTSDLSFGVSGTYTLVDVSPSLSTATRWDTLVTAITVTSNNDVTTLLLNLVSFFGFSDWTTGTAKTVTGLNGDGTSFTETTDKDLISISEGASSASLFFGDESGTLDSGGYPTTLESTAFFTSS